MQQKLQRLQSHDLLRQMLELQALKAQIAERDKRITELETLHDELEAEHDELKTKSENLKIDKAIADRIAAEIIYPSKNVKHDLFS
jgi:hypothetical protein